MNRRLSPRECDDRTYAASPYRVARALAAALRVPDPQRSSGLVKRYAPDGTLLETVTPHDWATRYPRRFMRPSSPGRRRISW